MLKTLPPGPLSSLYPASSTLSSRLGSCFKDPHKTYQHIHHRGTDGACEWKTFRFFLNFTLAGCPAPYPVPEPPKVCLSPPLPPLTVWPHFLTVLSHLTWLVFRRGFMTFNFPAGGFPHLKLSTQPENIRPRMEPTEHCRGLGFNRNNPLLGDELSRSRLQLNANSSLKIRWKF